ncbi:MAG: hypothetical protein M3541_05485 [Acidobacteriota bacterium]|nr:hypothetical protein [Acidobacteriota bacterium]
MTAVLAGIAAPAFAGNPTTTPPPSSRSTATSPFTRAAIARALAAAPAADVATSAPAPFTPPAKAPQTSNGFLKSRTGVIVLAIFAAGTGYAIYSAKEDRIRGRNR